MHFYTRCFCLVFGETKAVKLRKIDTTPVLLIFRGRLLMGLVKGLSVDNERSL